MNETSHPANAMTERIKSYIAERAHARLEKFDKETDSLAKKQEPDKTTELLQDRAEKRQEIEESFKPVNWLADAANRAKQIQLVTHALKFTHSDARGSSLYSPATDSEHSGLLSSQSLSPPQTDVVGNAAALDVGKLLQLEEQGTALIDFIRQANAEPFIPLAQSQTQADDWVRQFSVVITAAEPASHKLAKQIYWPVANNYHLLSPLFATSLTQEIFEKVQHAKFSEESKAARAARRNEAMHDTNVVFYPELAVQSFGGTKPQNISQLNSSRGGKSYLFSSAPPHWQRQDKPPLHCKSVFDGPFSRLVYRRTEELRLYLEKHKDDLSLSRYKKRRKQMVEGIIDELVMYRTRLQHFDAGWSAQAQCKLPRHQQLWLDQGRRLHEPEFQQELDANEWQKQVAADFARFLNHRLESGHKLVTDHADYAQWLVEAAQEIRLLTQQNQEVL